MATRSSDRAAPGDRKRVALLEAAYGLIAEKGLGGLRTRDVVERAGVNISMLHYYFGTKDALIVAVAEHTQLRWKDADGEHAPRTLLEHLEASAHSFRADPRLAVVLQELSLHAVRDAATRASFAENFREWNRRVAAIVREEQRLGLRRADLDPERAAIVITSFMMGASTQLGVDPQAFDFADLSAQLDRWLAGA